MYYKVRNPFCIALIGIVIFSTFKPDQVFAQDTGFKAPPHIRDIEEFAQQANMDSTYRMIELKTLIPNLVYDLRYASTLNFMHRQMYPKGTRTTFLRLNAAKQLLLVQQELSQSGLGLKIFDAYRPFSVTVKFWELVKDERYVANPSKGSGHNRGIAVDLTIIDLKSGKELDMGTGFDNFTDTAHQDFKNLSEPILQNRNRLRTVMEKYGFVALQTEWWHYYLKEGNKFDILDLSFKQLGKLKYQ